LTYLLSSIMLDMDLV